jgi:hypothetical protein
VARAAAVTGIHDAAFLNALAGAAVRAMPQLSAADICSVVESFSGGWHERGQRGWAWVGVWECWLAAARLRLPSTHTHTHTHNLDCLTADLDCYSIEFKDATADLVLDRSVRAGCNCAVVCVILRCSGVWQALLQRGGTPQLTWCCPGAGQCGLWAAPAAPGLAVAGAPMPAEGVQFSGGTCCGSPAAPIRLS